MIDPSGTPVVTASTTPGESDQPWQRLHPLTPWLRNWAALLILGGAIINYARNDLAELITFGQMAGFWRIGLGVVVVFSLVVAYNLVWWRRARFQIGSESVHLIWGILTHHQRSLRLDQLEAIDIVYPLVARLLGLAELRLEAVGGTDSQLSLAYLTRRQAETLRAEILTQRSVTISGVPTADTPTHPGDPMLLPHQIGLNPPSAAWQADATPESGETTEAGMTSTDPTSQNAWQLAKAQLVIKPSDLSVQGLRNAATHLMGPGEGRLFQVPPRWTIGAYFLSWEPWLMLILALVAFILTWLTASWGVLVGYLPLLVSFARSLWNRLVTEMGFTGYRQPDGIRLTHGLTTQINQSIPGHRVQAIRLRQRLWWRHPGWWRIDLNVAGYGVITNVNENRALLVPVADAAMARTAIAAVMPQATSAEVWPLIEQAMSGDDHPAGFTTSPASAKLFNPFAWSRQGYARCDFALVIRGGRFTRQVTIVPHQRIQGLELNSGPWQRRRGLASLNLHSTMGPIAPRIPHLAESDMTDLLADETPLVNRTVC